MNEIFVRRNRLIRRRLKVLVCLSLSSVAGQRKLAGIFSYLGADSDWDLQILRDFLYVQPDNFAELVQSADGIILSALPQEAALVALARAKCPLIMLEYKPTELRKRKHLVTITNDANAIASSAADLFRQIGRIKSYAYIHPRQLCEWSLRRERALRNTLRGQITVNVYRPGNDQPDESRLNDFLNGLPRPTAILAANDERAAEVLRVAEKMKLKIPNDLSLLGIDNDPYVCDNGDMGISSIEPDHFLEGKLAAESLDQLMHGKGKCIAKEVHVGVKRIIVRDTTLYLPPAESLVQRVMAHVEAHALEPISPATVSRQLGISHSLIRLRLREARKPSLAKQIADLRLKEAARLLRETKIRLGVIHSLCGYTNANSFKNLFRRRYGISMREYRAQH